MILTDADIHLDPNINFDSNGIPRKRFLTGKQAYLKLRRIELSEKKVSFASRLITYGLVTVIRDLFYGFHCL